MRDTQPDIDTLADNSRQDGAPHPQKDIPDGRLQRLLRAYRLIDLNVATGANIPYVLFLP